MVSGFPIIALQASAVAPANWFTFAVNFGTDNRTPANMARAIQIQFQKTTSEPVLVTLDNGSTSFAINNGNPVAGLVTFTMLVTNTTQLNFSSATADVSNIIISGT